MKKIEPLFDYDEKSGLTSCIISYNNETFYGIAKCNEIDKDFQTQLVGEHIAYERAMIQALKFEKNNIIKPKLAALKQLYYSINHSKKFNPKSYATRMLYRQIHIQEDDLEVVNELIKNKQKELKEYIDMKDQAYKKIRKWREKANIN